MRKNDGQLALKNDTKSDQSFQNDNILMLDEEEVILKHFKSIYYQLNAKPDSTTQVYRRNVTISKDDTIDLNERIAEKIKNHYQDDGFIVTINVFLKNGKSREFTNWKEFVSRNWTDCVETQSVVLKWDVNIRLPKYKIPQRHCLMVKMSSGLRPEEVLRLILSGEIEDINSIEVDNCPIVARVDFVNQSLGDELLDIVTNWVSGLKKAVDSKNLVILFLKKNRKKVAYAINYSIVFLVVVLLSVIINYQFNNIGVEYLGEVSVIELLHILNTIIAGLLSVFIVSKLFTLLAQKVFSLLEGYGSSFLFNITRGDSNRQEALRDIDKKKESSIIKNIVLAVIANIVFMLLLRSGESLSNLVIHVIK